MCGRFTLRAANRELAQLFHAILLEEPPPRYNIAPTQDVAIVRHNAESGQRELTVARWGLIPPWADDEKIGNRMINARAETLGEKTSFKRPLQQRRCLIPADGFYEWEQRGGTKQPYFIHRPDDKPFAFAGLWERWRKAGPVIDSCTIITTTANERLSHLHERMPVILAPQDYEIWLDPQIDDIAELQKLLQPCPAGELELYPVSKLVNSPRHESHECTAPLEQQGELF